ncbi:hypothetical protein I3842_15G018800 [Carya illinoinensis]|uniref:Protein kinase domain-containing protein n=1 Tax=Carya illinoinensis TaxID=32201 RepID=A0A922ACA4_CARIL|nr:hypothetical protein I3842_15G018800 [Carya illinoinensis]KAG6673974.1 hypothetical protein I3842_15G018800 [Carya illinoinensis]
MKRKVFTPLGKIRWCGSPTSPIICLSCEKKIKKIDQENNLPITVKADVYSFGIVFFVIICCRKRLDNDAHEEEAILIKWVKDCFKANEVSKLCLKKLISKVWKG